MEDHTLDMRDEYQVSHEKLDTCIRRVNFKWIMDNQTLDIWWKILTGHEGLNVRQV